jgi:hypothetical protein
MLHFKTIFSIIVTILLLGCIGLAGYVGYNYLDAQQYSPESITDQFIELAKNPTTTITNEEKSTLSKITETNFLSQIQLETSLNSIRTLAKDKTLTITKRETKTKQYSQHTAQISSPGFEYNFIMFVETKGSIWTGGNRSKIYKFEFPDIPNANNLGKQDDSLKKITEGLTGLFDTTKKIVDDKIKGIEIKNPSNESLLRN